MKLSPDLKQLEELLRSSKFVAGGFLGNDPRSLTEIIEHDLAELNLLGYSVEQVTQRMDEITQRALEGHGMAVQIDPTLTAVADEARGSLVCPWHDNRRFSKTVVTATRGQLSVHWSDLSLHLIRAHGFFQGRGSAFRIEPRDLVAVIFTPRTSAPSSMEKYICKACGYIYDPAQGDPLNNIPPNTPFEQLPDSWHCPMCGAPKSMFKRYAGR